ncbi:MAG: SSI family serine proteinase inhibitor [Streptosporangiaceae bacterium]
MTYDRTTEKLQARRLASGLRTMVPGITLAGALLASAALVACGSVAPPGAPGGAPTAPKASLTITVRNGPGQKVSHWTLRCAPVGGTHPDAAGACAALLAVKNPFAPARPGAVCPQFLVAGHQATFTGTWFGTRVNRTFVDGGCDYAIWVKLAPVLH